MNIQFADLAQIVTAVIGVLGNIIVVLIKLKIKDSPQPEIHTEKSRKLNAAIWICSLIIILNIAFLGWRLFFTTPQITITYPEDNSMVVQREVAEGQYSWLPFGHHPWLVVYSHKSGRYYPQNEPAQITLKGDWSSIIFLGLPDTVGEEFDILVTIPRGEALRIFEEYLNTGKRTGSWPGLNYLPEGTDIYDRVMVTRK